MTLSQSPLLIHPAAPLLLGVPVRSKPRDDRRDGRELEVLDTVLSLPGVLLPVIGHPMPMWPMMAGPFA